MFRLKHKYLKGKLLKFFLPAGKDPAFKGVYGGGIHWRLSGKVLQISFFFIATVLLVSGCYKREQLSIIPEISLGSCELVPVSDGVDSFKFVIHYKDGDGDIGYKPTDTYKPYNDSNYFGSDLFIQYLELQNGTYVYTSDPFHGINDTIQIPFRLPALNDSKNPQPITGDIKVGAYLIQPHKQFKTFKFRIFLFDKALHQSNIIETPSMQW